MSASTTLDTTSPPNYVEILDETLELLGLFGNASTDLDRLHQLLNTHFQEDAAGMNFRSLCCFGRVGENVSLDLFNRLCILPKTEWGIQLITTQGTSISPHTLDTEETTKFTSDFASTVAGILHAILRGVIGTHSKKEKISNFIPPTGIPLTWFKAIVGPEYKQDTQFPLAPVPTLRDRILRCLDHALQQKIVAPAAPFFCAESGAYWQEVDELFNAHNFYLICCSDFPAYLDRLIEEKKSTLDKLAGLKAPSTRHYGVESMVQDAYTRATKQGMEWEDLLLPDKTLGGTVIAIHNRMLSAQWIASYLVDTDNNFFMDDIRAKAMNEKERMLRIFSMDHTYDKPTWMQFGEKNNIFLYLSQRASAAEEGWLTIANYVINLLIDFINKKLDNDKKGKEFKLERMEYTVGVASLANPSLGLFSLHSDAKPGILLILPLLVSVNSC